MRKFLFSRSFIINQLGNKISNGEEELNMAGSYVLFSAELTSLY